MTFITYNYSRTFVKVLSFNIVFINAIGQLLHIEDHEMNHIMLLCAGTNA